MGTIRVKSDNCRITIRIEKECTCWAATTASVARDTEIVGKWSGDPVRQPGETPASLCTADAHRYLYPIPSSRTGPYHRLSSQRARAAHLASRPISEPPDHNRPTNEGQPFLRDIDADESRC
jgi:hypothetical protein